MGKKVEIRLFHIERLPKESRRPTLFRRACRLALGYAKAPGGLNVIFLGRHGMRQINKRYLGHDYDTDVLAFPHDSQDGPFGEVLVSTHQARRQARQLKHSIVHEVLILIIHGILHLTGYEDTTPRQKKKMFSRQEMILKRTLKGGTWSGR